MGMREHRCFEVSISGETFNVAFRSGPCEWSNLFECDDPLAAALRRAVVAAAGESCSSVARVLAIALDQALSRDMANSHNPAAIKEIARSGASLDGALYALKSAARAYVNEFDAVVKGTGAAMNPRGCNGTS